MTQYLDPAPPPSAFTPAAEPSPLGLLCEVVEQYLQRCAHPSVIGAELAQALAASPAPSRLEALLECFGYAGDAAGFFAAVRSTIEETGTRRRCVFSRRGLQLPHTLLLSLLEVLEPGDALHDIHTVEQLETLLQRRVAEGERASLQEVLERFPVRLSQHILRQLRLSPAVGLQYLPFVDELSTEGLVHTWVGQFHSGVIERMYRNRVIMILNMSCPVYCRFCFRKHKECRQERPPTKDDVARGVHYVASCPEISEVVLTGGDPFMNRVTLCSAVEGLLGVDHVRILRLATRSLAYHPALFTQHDRFWMEYLKAAQMQAAEKGQRIEVATHFIHPDEISLRSLDLIAELVSAGVGVYVQSPLLGGINDGGEELVELYSRLRGAGAEVHYVFMPCSPLQGNRAYRSSVDDGMRLAARLRARISDRAMPRFCTATAFGKIDWGANGWTVEEDVEDPRFVWLRTPYTMETFAPFTKDLDLSPVARVNAGGTLDARFMVAAGDRRWLRGRSLAGSAGDQEPGPRGAQLGAVAARYRRLQAECRTGETMAPLRRVHHSRVELDCGLADNELAAVVAELAGWQGVSDVVLWSSGTDPLAAPERLGRLMDLLAELPAISALRVRSERALAAPHEMQTAAVELLGSRNRLGAVAPVRVELELPVLHGSELDEDHGLLADRLRRSGVSVYVVAPLVAGLNASPQAVHDLSARCRRYGIEFQNLVVAGSPAQRRWNRQRPLSDGLVIEIASELRRLGSGRELPRYLVETPFGEVDLGVSGEVVGNDERGAARLRLLAYGVGDPLYLKDGRGEDLQLEVDAEGHPIVAVPGLRAS